jgi:hypothetical protein
MVAATFDIWDVCIWLVSSSCCICQSTVPSINSCCILMVTNPTITPFAIYVGQLSSFFFSTGLHLAALSSLPFWEHFRPSLQLLAITFNHQSHQNTPFLTQKSTTTRWSTASHLKSVITCLWDNIPLRAYQSCSIQNYSTRLTSRLTTPPQTKISISKCDSYYLSISIWSRAHHSFKSLLIQELCLPFVPP